MGRREAELLLSLRRGRRVTLRVRDTCVYVYMYSAEQSWKRGDEEHTEAVTRKDHPVVKCTRLRQI